LPWIIRPSTLFDNVGGSATAPCGHGSVGPWCFHGYLWQRMAPPHN